MKLQTKFWIRSLLIIILISSLTLVGCEEVDDSTSNTTTDNNEQTTTITENNTNNTTNYNSYVPRLEGKAIVQMVINGSPITIEVDGENAPITAGNFVDLVERKVYDGLVFHRVIREPDPFVAQGGDPLGNGTGGFIDPNSNQRRYIPLEIRLEGDENPTYSRGLGRQAGINSPNVVLPHSRGAIAMARSQAPDSASSQFYFALADLAFLDGDYAVFGYVTQGMNIVDGIKQGDKIDSATVIEGLDNLIK